MYKIIKYIILTTVLFSSNVKEMTVGIWPEYEHAGSLVYFQVESNPNSIPYILEIEVPDSVMLAMAACKDSSGSIGFNALEIKRLEGYSYIPIVVDEPRKYVQFFHNFKEKKGTLNVLNYNFSSNQSIDSLFLMVQRPLFASKFDLNLEGLEETVDEFDIVYKFKSFGPYSNGEKIPISVKYDNPNSLTTKSMLSSDHFSNEEQEPKSKNNFDIANIYNKLPMKILTLLIPMIVILAIIIRKNSTDVS